jgi:peptidoglycan/xylan/chitin deacetylase (PgdA/CDA1 family)
LNYKHKILESIYYPYKGIGNLYNIFGKKNNLRVLLFHDICRKDFHRFRTKIEWLSKDWNFVSVSDFEKMIKGDKAIIGNNLLLTFDDGFLSNYFLAKEILNVMGIPALFFIITEFCRMEDEKKQKLFLEENLYPKWKGEAIPAHKDELVNMSLDNIKYLIKSGHKIGYHTASHQRLSNIKENYELENEIITGADKLESLLNIKLNHFAFTFGDINSFSKQALDIGKSRFEYIYTGMRGSNSKNLNSLAIRRDTIAIKDTNNLIGSFLIGAADFVYKKDLKLYESWIS